VAMVLGAVMLIASPVPEMRVRWSTAIGLALPFSAITVFLLTIAVRARNNKVETGEEGMIGETGNAITAAREAWDGSDFVGAPPGDGADPYNALAFRGRNALDDEFFTMAHRVFDPMRTDQDDEDA